MYSHSTQRMEMGCLDYAVLKDGLEVVENPSPVDRMIALFDGSVLRVEESDTVLFYRYCDSDGLKVSEVSADIGFSVQQEPYDFSFVLEDYGVGCVPRVVTILT